MSALEDMLVRDYERAIDNRRFEIELFWRRSGYFWGFITVAFAGYGALAATNLANADKHAVQLSMFAIACFGFICSVAWTLANLGSKRWQHHWEMTVRDLEDQNPSGQKVFRRDARDAWDIRFGRAPYSVSRLATILSLFTAFVWAGLLLNALPPTARSKVESWVSVGGSADVSILWVTLATFVMLIVFGLSGRASFNSSQHVPPTLPREPNPSASAVSATNTTQASNASSQP